MSLEAELAAFVRSRPAFWNPIASAFSISGPTPPVDNRILSRLCYGNAPQNAGSAPYLVWDGPYDYDQGTVAQGAIAQKTARFWFTVYAQYFDDAVDWMTAIENDLLSAFTPGTFFNLSTVRIMSMVYIPNTKFPSRSDQVQRTGQEFPLNGFTIAYQICWQPL